MIFTTKTKNEKEETLLKNKNVKRALKNATTNPRRLAIKAIRALEQYDDCIVFQVLQEPRPENKAIYDIGCNLYHIIGNYAPEYVNLRGGVRGFLICREAGGVYRSYGFISIGIATESLIDLDIYKNVIIRNDYCFYEECSNELIKIY